MAHFPKASKAFEDFSGHKARSVKKSRLPDKPVSGWKMGPVVGIAYQAKRDGKTKQYFHEFKPKARPDLVAQDDGRQLYIDGGKYKVTDKGIEDMPQLFVVNPSARRKPRRAASKRRAAPMRRRRRTATRRRATRQVAVFRANPVRRRRRRSVARRRTYARNPIVATRRVRRRRRSVGMRRYRRNPSARGAFGGAVSFGKMLLPAAGIGLGAVGSEIIMGYLPIPPNFKTGVMRHVTKGVVGVTAGMLIAKLLRQKRLGNYIALGAVVIAVHDAVKEVIAARMPSVPFGMYRGPIASSFAGLGYTNPGQIGQYVDTPASSFAAAGEMDFAV